MKWNFSPTLLGLISGLLSALAFAAMALLIKEQSAVYPSNQLSFFRGLLGVMTLWPWVVMQRPKLFERQALYLWVRSLAGGVGVVIFFLNIKLALASNARAVSNLSPVITALLLFVFFRQIPKWIEIIGLAMIVAGAILLRYSPQHPLTNDVMILGLIHAFMAALAYISLKQASKDYSTFVIVWLFSLCVACASYFSPGLAWPIPKAQDFFWLLAPALAGLIGQFLLTHSHIHLDNTLASALTLLGMPMIILWECLMQNRELGKIEIFSYLILILGLVIKIYYRRLGALWQQLIH